MEGSEIGRGPAEGPCEGFLVEVSRRAQAYVVQGRRVPPPRGEVIERQAHADLGRALDDAHFACGRLGPKYRAEIRCVGHGILLWTGEGG